MSSIKLNNNTSTFHISPNKELSLQQTEGKGIYVTSLFDRH